MPGAPFAEPKSCLVLQGDPRGRRLVRGADGDWRLTTKPKGSTSKPKGSTSEFGHLISKVERPKVPKVSNVEAGHLSHCRFDADIEERAAIRIRWSHEPKQRHRPQQSFRLIPLMS